MDILSVNSRIQSLEISLSEARRKSFSLEMKLEEVKKAIDFLEFQAKKEFVFDTTLKNAEQREIKAQEALLEKQSYQESKELLCNLKREIFDSQEVERNIKSEVDSYKRIFQVLLNQFAKVEA